jgi:restriction endonuclease S subunit
MNKKKLVDLIEELKQQLNKDTETDLDNYKNKLSERADEVINHFQSMPGDVVVINKYPNGIDFLTDDDSCEY